MAADQQKTEPGVEGIDGHDEEDADNVALLIGNGVIFQVQKDLEGKTQDVPIIALKYEHRRAKITRDLLRVSHVFLSLPPSWSPEIKKKIMPPWGLETWIFKMFFFHLGIKKSGKADKDQM